MRFSPSLLQPIHPACSLQGPTFPLSRASLLTYSEPFQHSRLSPPGPWSPLQPHCPLISPLLLLAGPQTVASPPARPSLSAGSASTLDVLTAHFLKSVLKCHLHRVPFSAALSKALRYPLPLLLLCFCYSIYHELKLYYRPTIQFQNP